MAADIIVFDPSTDEEDEEKPVVLPSKQNNSSSDSSDSEAGQPVLKKSRSTARWRTRPPLEDVSNEKQAPSLGLYCVSGTLNLKASIPDMDNTEDLDEEEKVIKVPKNLAANKPCRSSSRQQTSRIPEPDFCVVDDYGDDEDEVTVTSSSSGRDRSPTPPPSAGGRFVPQGRKRRAARTPKATKQAMGNLESLQGRLRMERMMARRNEMLDDIDDVVLLDDAPNSQSPRKEINVKIRSVHGIRRFPMGKNESFSRVLTELAEKEGVTEEHIVLYHKDQVVMPYSTPRLLEITVADILDCHTVVRNSDDEEEEEEDLDDLDDPTMVRLKLRGKNKRTAAVTIRIKKTDPLEKLMREYALKCGLPFESLTFHFDGDLIARGETANNLDMEDDDCIDVSTKDS